MAGIVGISGAEEKQKAQVSQMLGKITHRGASGSKVVAHHGVTLGAVWSTVETVPTSPALQSQAAWDGSPDPLPALGMRGPNARPFAIGMARPEGVVLARDPLGVRPLYYGWIDDDRLCFASEVKALLEVTQHIHEFPPGTWYDNQAGFRTFDIKTYDEVYDQTADTFANDLRVRLEQAVCRRISGDVMGSWLSGGLDSSAMAALAQPHVKKLYTFVSGVPGAPDLAFARRMADFLGSDHHEVIVSQADLVKALPDVIYHLESFDALLVRSSVTNYLTAQLAAKYVGAVLSGEGADELFGGYAYIKDLPPQQVPKELQDITKRLHNTALQRVDRSASAHGLIAYVPFLDADVVTYAAKIPSRFKVYRNGQTVIEKWILRRALEGVLPDDVLWRRKAKFWQGAGVGDLLACYAEENVSDTDFAAERTLPNGWSLATKEELLYYRIFAEHFGDAGDLSWMGRTKGAPRA